MTKKEMRIIINAAIQEHKELENCTDILGVRDYHTARHRCAWCALDELLLELGIKQSLGDFNYLHNQDCPESVAREETTVAE